MEEFIKVIFGFLFCVLIFVSIAQIVRTKDCKEKGGVYASPHCFKKESLME